MEMEKEEVVRLYRKENFVHWNGNYDNKINQNPRIIYRELQPIIVEEPWLPVN